MLQVLHSSRKSMNTHAFQEVNAEAICYIRNHVIGYSVNNNNNNLLLKDVCVHVPQENNLFPQRLGPLFYNVTFLYKMQWVVFKQI